MLRAGTQTVTQAASLGGKPISSDIFLNAHTAPVEGFLLTTPEGGKV